MSLPKTKRKTKPRTGVRLPNPMMDEIDRIVKNHPELNYNRQQFIESAIREKIIQIRSIEMELKLKLQRDVE